MLYNEDSYPLYTIITIKGDVHLVCPNCNTQANENEKFCSACGFRLENTIDEAAVNEVPLSECAAEEVLTETEARSESVSEAASEFLETPSESPSNEVFSGDVITGRIPSAGRKLWMSLLAVALVVILGFGVLAAPIKNFFYRSVMPSDSFFRKVATDMIEDVSNHVATVFDSLPTDANQSAKGSVEVTIGDGLKDLVDEYGGYEASEAIEWLNSIKLDVNGATSSKRASGSVGIHVNDVDITSYDVVVDMAEGMLYMTLPDLNKTAIGAEADMGYEAEAYTELYDGLSKYMPKSSVVKKLLVRYLTCIVKQVDEVDKSKDSIEAGGVSQNCNKLSVTVDAEMLLNAARSVLEEAKTDKDLKKVIIDFATIAEEAESGVDPEEAYEEFVEGIKSALEELEDAEEYISDEDMPEIILNLWVNGKCEAIGFGFEFDDGYETAEFVSIETRKGGNFGSSLFLDVDGEGFGFEGSGKVSGNKYTGEFVFNVNGLNIISISTNKLDADKLADGIISGSLTISAADSVSGLLSMVPTYERDMYSMLTELSLTIDSSSSKDKADCTLTVNREEDLLLSMKVKSTIGNGKPANAPKDYVDAEDSSEMQDWAYEIDFETLIDKLEKAGLPSEWIDMLQEAIDSL